MSENSKCPKCGAPLSPDSPEGLCPRCLVAMNLATQTEMGGGGATATTPLPIDEVAKLFPQLEILECLGRGGMGAVYKARQPRLDRIVALKILSPEKQNEPKFAKRFEREARAGQIASSKHRRCLRFWHSGTAAATWNGLASCKIFFCCKNQDMNIRLDGKRALVTGANSGIGEAIALALGEAGAKVAVNYLVNPGAANTVVEKIKKNSDAIAIETDISKADAVASMFKQIDQAWGGVDILVNNAGIDGARAFGWEANTDSWRRVIEINLFGAFHCSREAMKRMVPQKNGVVLNISSVHEVIPWSGYSAYTASKGAIAMMAKTLALEAAPHNVRVLCLGPGAIKTPINRDVWSNPDNMKDLLEKIPMNRIGEAEEIGQMAVVLVSDVASYVTGRTVFVDGGMTDYPSFEHGG